MWGGQIDDTAPRENTSSITIKKHLNYLLVLIKITRKGKTMLFKYLHQGNLFKEFKGMGSSSPRLGTSCPSRYAAPGMARDKLSSRTRVPFDLICGGMHGRAETLKRI